MVLFGLIHRETPKEKCQDLISSLLIAISTVKSKEKRIISKVLELDRNTGYQLEMRKAEIKSDLIGLIGYNGSLVEIAKELQENLSKVDSNDKNFFVKYLQQKNVPKDIQDISQFTNEIVPHLEKNGISLDFISKLTKVSLNV